MNKICYLCGSDKNEEIFNENGIPILKCKNCSHVFSSFEQAEHYDGYWNESEESYDLEWWDKAHRNIYEEFISKFMKLNEGYLVDVGCGLGFFLKLLKEKKVNWKTLGYEMSEQAVKFAKEKNGLDQIYSGMVEKSGIGKNSIDIITLWDVIEHIPKPQPLLNYLHSILKPGGILFLQTPNFPIQLVKAKLKVMKNGMKEGIHYLEAKDHINDYSMKTMIDLSQQTNFKSCEFHVMTPILSVAGSKKGVLAKKSFYHLTNAIWNLSFKNINLNNTLFAVLKK